MALNLVFFTFCRDCEKQLIMFYPLRVIIPIEMVSIYPFKKLRHQLQLLTYSPRWLFMITRIYIPLRREVKLPLSVHHFKQRTKLHLETFDSVLDRCFDTQQPASNDSDNLLPSPFVVDLINFSRNSYFCGQIGYQGQRASTEKYFKGSVYIQDV